MQQQTASLETASHDHSSSGVDALELRPLTVAAERFIEAAERRASARMFRLNLTMPQLRAALTIRRHARVSGRQMAAALGLTPGAIVAVCDRLEQLGYVQRVIDRVDRRITWFELTPAGLAALKPPPALAGKRAQTKALIAALTREERQGFIKVADALADALDEAADVEQV